MPGPAMRKENPVIQQGQTMGNTQSCRYRKTAKGLFRFYLLEQKSGFMPGSQAIKSPCVEEKPGGLYDHPVLFPAGGWGQIAQRLKKKIVRQWIRLTKVENRGWP